MRALLPYFFLTCLGASAQDWALLNPTYKYNYSLGGTDTITNQIFVTHIDTLGVDSFRYELNRIGVVCDTCPASLGGPCDGCFVWANQPQFLQRSVIRSGGSWLFVDPDTLRIRTDAGTGEEWMFDPANGTMATTDTIIASEVLGQLDSTMVILLSNGDSVLLSRSFGLQQWPNVAAAPAFSMIGIQELDLGTVVPSLPEFFAMEFGDVLEYDTGWSSGSWPWYLGSQSFTKWTITDRYADPDSVSLAYASVSHDYHIEHNWMTDADYGFDWTNVGSGTWNIPQNDTLPALQLIFSYPGQVTALSTLSGGHVLCVAEHGIDSSGAYAIKAHRFPGSEFWESFSFFFPSGEVAPGLFAMEIEAGMNNAEYRSGVGLFDYHLGFGESEEHYNLLGAVLSGDTIGHVQSDGVILGVTEQQRSTSVTIHPNPATIGLVISRPESSPASWFILDPMGRSVGHGTLQREKERIDVGGLPEGTYVLRLSDPSGISSQRFVVAR